MKRLGAIGLAVLATAGSMAAASAAADESEAPGRILYEERCGGCHMEGGFGTRVLARRVSDGQAELTDREILPVALTTAVVRRGIGSMPQIRQAELDDAQLAAIARYLDKSQ